MKQQKKVWMARACLMAAGLLLALSTTVLWPVVEEARVDYADGGREKIGVLTDGDVVEQPLHTDLSEISEVNVKVETSEESKAMTLTLALMRDGRVVAQETYPLAKVRMKSRLRLNLPAGTRGGACTLRVTASGEGKVSLTGGEGGAPATVDGLSQATALYVRLDGKKRRVGVQTVYLGGMLVLLGLTPGGGKRGARREA